MLNISPEDEARVMGFLQLVDDFATGASKVCPNCGKLIDGVKMHSKSEPDTYSMYLACGCRMGLWSDVPQWIRDDGLPIEYL